MKSTLKIVSIWLPAILFTFTALTLLSCLEDDYQNTMLHAKTLQKEFCLQQSGKILGATTESDKNEH